MKGSWSVYQRSLILSLWTHNAVIPILNSEPTNFFDEYLLWFRFQLANWEKNTCLGPIRFHFQLPKLRKFSVKHGETNWWKHLMNSLFTVVNLNSDGMKWPTTPIYTLLSNILALALKKLSNLDYPMFSLIFGT